MLKLRNYTINLSCLIILASCSLKTIDEPEYKYPKNYKEDIRGESITAEELAIWQDCEVLRASIKDKPWQIFKDKKLAELIQKIEAQNPSLQGALARIEKARSLARSVKPTILPELNLGANVAKAKNSVAGAAGFGGNSNAEFKPYTVFNSGLTASYEVDLFGQVRNNYKAVTQDIKMSEELYNDLKISLYADLAEYYFTVRITDNQINIANEMVKTLQEVNRIRTKSFEQGKIAQIDKNKSEIDLANSKANLASLFITRQQAEHNIAILLGVTPAEFSLAAVNYRNMPPKISSGLTSSLLVRRPDIKVALHNMKAANLRFAVAKTAFFPQVSFLASGGYESSRLKDLFNWSNTVWSLGQMGASAISQVIFDNGRTSARVAINKAEYQEAVANYRQTILKAIGEVEDHLVAQNQYQDSAIEFNKIVNFSKKNSDLAKKIYQAGSTDYSAFATDKIYELNNRLKMEDLTKNRFIVSVSLMRSLGGSW